MTAVRKRDLHPGLKWTVLRMRNGYLATEPSHDTCYCAGSLNEGGVTVNECARGSGLKSRSANNTGNMRPLSVVHDYGGARQFSEYNRKEVSAMVPCFFLSSFNYFCLLINIIDFFSYRMPKGDGGENMFLPQYLRQQSRVSNCY